MLAAGTGNIRQREIEFLPVVFVNRVKRGTPATSASEKISFNQLNQQTGDRIKYMRLDAEEDFLIQS
jgi:non-homologous end joining protein Ku